MSGDRFISFFRMSRSTFKDLVTIEGDLVFKNDSRMPQLHPSIQIAVALYQLGLQGNSAVPFPIRIDRSFVPLSCATS